jgi:hypothetical protein
MAERVAEAKRFLDFLFDMETANLRTLLADNDASMIALSFLYVLGDVNNEGGTINRFDRDERRINRFVQCELRAGELEEGQLRTLLLWKDNFAAVGLYKNDAPIASFCTGTVNASDED